MTIDLGEQCSNFDLNASACLIDWLLMFGACGSMELYTSDLRGN